ncbi:response regulator transcription factor [Lachnospiraceae bacterium OttesenSCG-928-D06]|nr:response regulator transcription factor [Lachnospiraceae bacterium OttesenSCG-928-D06]
MNIIAVDDEELALHELNAAICEALPYTSPVCFRKANDALDYAKKMPVDVAFLDIEMGSGMNGLTLAQELNMIQPSTNIIFVTGYSEYMEEAFSQYASGYVKKPVRAKRILREMAHLRHKKTELTTLDKPWELGPYLFDHTAQRVYYNGCDTLLTPKEYQIISLLAHNIGIFFTIEEIYKKVWGDEYNENLRTVYRHISKMRIKLNMKGGEGYNVEAKRNVGYRLVYQL